MSEIMSCPHCGGEMTVTPDLHGQVVACPHCRGQLSIPYPQAASPTPPTSYTPRVPRHVPNYLALSILTTIFCCLPFGIVGIVYAAQANGKKASGDYSGALSAADTARTWCIIGIVCGALAVVIGLMMGIAPVVIHR